MLKAWAFPTSKGDALERLQHCLPCEEVAAAVMTRSIRCSEGHEGLFARNCGHQLHLDLRVCQECYSQRLMDDTCLIRADYAVDPIWCIPDDGCDEVLGFFCLAFGIVMLPVLSDGLV